jgi:vitamin B12 transporter
MSKLYLRTAWLIVLLPLGSLSAQPAASLPEMTVYSPRVANQEPVATFAMPVSVLRFEPRVDLQGRNFAEGQADIAIRGGTFENTGVRIGAASLYDPQTGHYFTELPIAPAMLTAPGILTGADNAIGGWNATAGTVSYGWRPIRTGGAFTLGAGQYAAHREELYAGFVSDTKVAGQQLAADADFAQSAAHGSRAFGEHRFTRAGGRVQLHGTRSQTDLAVGYQEKFFGWTNLYTPFNSNETENLQTLLVDLNHRVDLGGGDFAEFGAYHRRNKDDYAFNRFAPLGATHPFQHTTRVDGANLDGRATYDDLAIGYKAGVLRDELASTSLTSGRYHSRTFTSAGVYPEKRWSLDADRALVVTAGLTFEDTNRDGSSLSPLLVVARETRRAGAEPQRLYASYARTTQEPTYTALNSSATAGLFRGNPDLQRSASHNVELGASGAWFGWQTNAAVFFRRDEHLVDWTFRRGVTARTANAVDIDTSGVELFARHSFDRIDLVLGYTWLAKDADYGAAAVDASFYALNYPTHRLTAAVTARLGHDWEVRLDNDLRLQADNLLRNVGGDEALLSALGVYFHPPQSRKLTLALQVDNLWNSNFQAVPAVPAGRRQFAGSIGYVW